MRKSDKIQVTLLFFGLLLILGTYFFYPKINENKVMKEEIKKTEKDQNEISENVTNTFENIEYKGIYGVDQNFTVKSEKATVLTEDTDVILMEKMKVELFMDDGRIIIITSDKGKYNKLTYDCFFEKNVKATDGETKILAENLDLLATENLVNIYNNVRINYPTGSLEADKIDYDFETKYFKVSMFNDEDVKMKVFK